MARPTNRLWRILKHRWLDDTDTRRALDGAALDRLAARVADSETRHSGEIRLSVEAGLPLSYLWQGLGARERAVTLFGKLRVWDTEDNNGVLIYLLLAEHAIEIVADRGLARHVPAAHWQSGARRHARGLPRRALRRRAAAGGGCRSRRCSCSTFRWRRGRPTRTSCRTRWTAAEPRGPAACFVCSADASGPGNPDIGAAIAAVPIPGGSMFHFTRQDSSLRWAAVIAGLSTFTACGGGGNNTTPPAAATRVVGVAATGAALAGASVTLIDADATTTDPAPQTTDGGGRYSFGVDGLKAPFALKVGYTQDGQAQTLYAVLGSADANADNTANITPLSHAVAALVAPGGDPAALEAPAALLAATTGAKAGALADAVATLVAVLGSDPAIRAALEAAAGSGASFDPVRTPFVADGSGIDAVLDQLTVSTNPPGAAAGTVQIQNNLQAVDGDAPAAPVRITPATTPASAPTLPPTASGDLPTAADLDAFAAPFNACYALPATQRVTARDTSGAATAIAAACDFAVADYLSSGYNWVQNQGPSLLNANLDGATFQRPQVALVIPPVRVSNPKEDKHPYCDQTQCVVVDMRGTLPAAGGQPIRRTFLLAKTGAAWKAVGNQRPYDMDVQLRVSRLLNQNATPLSPTNYFSASRYEGMLRLALNPSGPGDINDVRAARVSGPGLPAAGVVLSRSSRCTSDRFAIVGKNGDTYVVDNGNNVPRYWTGNSGNDFKIGGATHRRDRPDELARRQCRLRRDLGRRRRGQALGRVHLGVLPLRQHHTGGARPHPPPAPERHRHDAGCLRRRSRAPGGPSRRPPTGPTTCSPAAPRPVR
jgi:hypothetical protein